MLLFWLLVSSSSLYCHIYSGNNFIASWMLGSAYFVCVLFGWFGFCLCRLAILKLGVWLKQALFLLPLAWWIWKHTWPLAACLCLLMIPSSLGLTNSIMIMDDKLRVRSGWWADTITCLESVIHALHLCFPQLRESVLRSWSERKPMWIL